jgi:hypothetical protein
LTNISSSVWSFLEPYKTSGTPLPRAVLAKRCTKDNMLLNKLTAVALSAVKLGSHRSSPTSQSRINSILASYTALVLDLIEEDNQDLSDQQLRNLFTYLLGGISGKILSEIDFTSDELSDSVDQSWLQSSCMIISQISRRVTLSKSILKSLLNSMSKRIRSKLDPSDSGFVSQSPGDDFVSLDSSIENILMAIVVLMRHQKIKFSESLLQTLFVDSHPPYKTNFVLLDSLKNLQLRSVCYLSLSLFLFSLISSLPDMTLISLMSSVLFFMEQSKDFLSCPLRKNLSLIVLISSLRSMKLSSPLVLLRPPL